MEYKILTANLTIGMEEKVNAYSKQGRIPQWGLCYNEEFNQYNQAMVKKSKQNEL